ncbi:MAG: response regulator [Comamonadaceae bacterium]|nr:MAG: response regulator [Comamonadaceae bacterium]
MRAAGGILAAWLIATSACGPAAAAPAPAAVAGVLDLSAPGATDSLQPLGGEWSFAWQAFTDPRSDAPLPGTAPLPLSWNRVRADGKPPGAHGHATYQLQVRCPAGQQLALTVPMQRSAMHLYVNGRLAAAQGIPGASADTAQPALGRRAVLTEPFPCPLRITAHVSNFSHRSGGMVRAPVAGPIEQLAPDYKQRLALDTIQLGAYLVLGISPVFFFLVRRQEKETLLFGLFCLAQAAYADMTGERLLLHLAGEDTPWEVALKVEYLTWFGSMGLYAALVDQLFPRILHARALKAFIAACLFAMLLVVFSPARVFTHSVYPAYAAGVAMGLHIVASVARAGRRGRRDAGVLLAGMALLAGVLLLNLLQSHAGSIQRTATAFGLLGFVLSPALVMLRRLARALTSAEERSEAQREKVELLVRATHAGILDWDHTRNISRYSPRLLEIMGYPSGADTLAWPLFFQHVDPRDRDAVQERFLEQLRDRSVRAGEMKHEPLEYRLVRADGSTVWVHAEAISVRAGDGRTLRYICSFLDITDQRAFAEGLRRQNEALAENARLREDVERMSRHDLKTPLNSIIGVARLLREDAAVLPEQRELLAIAERAGYRMLEMVNLSLDLSRMEMGTYEFRPQAVNVADVVERVREDVQPMADDAHVRLKVDRARGAPVYARAEELLCYSILANLLKNAVEATPAGGTVAVRIEPGEPLRVRVCNPTRVPAAIANRFFDKYVTAGKRGGTGLGTYSARLMARVQEGDLGMRSGDDGTVVTLTLRPLGAEQLPAPAPFAPAATARAAFTAADFAPRRVLLVDDDEYNRLLLLRYLPAPPFTVESAANGRAACEAAARRWPDIVLVDLEMPVMNGLEAVAWIREREASEGLRRCIVVMMSSNDDAESARRALAAGSDRYLAKPFTREALLALLQELDGGGRAPVQFPLELEPPPAPVAAAPVAPDTPVQVDPALHTQVPSFLDSRRRMAAEMAAALASGDRGRLRALAHRAAGGLALFGFHWAAWQSRGISEQAREGDAGLLHEAIEALQAHLAGVQVR